MTEAIEARLRDHARAFDSLLQLIPAKVYYGEDTDNQWQRKKQTAAEARAAKRAKLDPDNAKSAKDVMDERARKRKREEEVLEPEGVGLEKPEEALKEPQRKAKKQKQNRKANNTENQPETEGNEGLVDAAAAKAAKRRERRERKKAKQQAKATKVVAKRTRKEQATALVEDGKADVMLRECSGSGKEDEESGLDHDPIDVTGLADGNAAPSGSISTAPSSPASPSPVFDAATGLSGTSSISSIAPPTFPTLDEQQHQPTKRLPLPKANPEELRARLQERIEALRAARKADTADGTPARNRQELMEARRRKEEQRRAHRKELRQKAREEELQQRDLALARGSPLLTPGFMSPASGSTAGPSPLREHTESAPNNFAFGRIAFSNGQQMTPSLDALVDIHKKKGPQDPQTALQAANKRAERISGLDPAKKADIEEKDVWLNAKKRVHGERIRDDSSLLKKTLKRKEKAKKKSEKEWNERIEGVQKGQAMRQKKREENLQKRRDEKGSKKGSKGNGAKKGQGKGKAKARPGFEGSFRAKVGAGGRK